MTLLNVYAQHARLFGIPHKDTGSMSPDAVRMVNTPIRLMGLEISSSTDASSCAEESRSISWFFYNSFSGLWQTGRTLLTRHDVLRFQ